MPHVRPTDQDVMGWSKVGKGFSFSFFLVWFSCFLLFWRGLVAAGEEERFLRIGDALLGSSGFERSFDVLFPEGMPCAPLGSAKTIQLPVMDQPNLIDKCGVATLEGSARLEGPRLENELFRHHPNHPCLCFGWEVRIGSGAPEHSGKRGQPL